MDVKFARIEGTSKSFYLTVAVLVLLVLAGVYSTYLMFAHGLYLSGMTNRVPWGLQIAMAIYYIGLSAGSLVVSGLYGIFGKMEYKPFARIAAYLAMLFLIAGLLSIFTDQGRIDRLFVMPFTYFNLTSMFSINPALYSGHIMICIIYLWALFKEKGTLTKIASLTVVLVGHRNAYRHRRHFCFGPQGALQLSAAPPQLRRGRTFVRRRSHDSHHGRACSGRPADTWTTRSSCGWDAASYRFFFSVPFMSC